MIPDAVREIIRVIERQADRLLQASIASIFLVALCLLFSLHKAGPMGYHVTCIAVILCIVVVGISGIKSILWSPGARRLMTINEVTMEIRMGFSNVKSGEVHQTFVGSNTIAGVRDFALLLKPRHPTVICRYFFISTAYDINFAMHSLTVNYANVTIKSYLWCEHIPTVLADIFTNVTVFPSKVIFTFSSRDDHKAGHPELFKSSESKDVVGLVVRGGKVAELIIDL